jgi:hypothetical protein
VNQNQQEVLSHVLISGEESGRPVCHDIKWLLEDGGSSLCDIDIQEAECEDGWSAGSLESWICFEYELCVEHVEDYEEELVERAERLSTLQAIQTTNATGQSWVLPEGWNRPQNIKTYYQESVSQRKEEFLATDLLCLYTLNTAFLSMGVFGCIFLSIGLCFEL